MDRVVLVTYKMHHKIPHDSTIRHDANFVAAIEEKIYALFSCELSQLVREIVFGAEGPPKTVAGLLDACKAIESQRQQNPRIQVAAMSSPMMPLHYQPGDPLPASASSSQSDTTKVLAELVKELKIARTWSTFHPRSTTMRCHYCGKMGHFQHNCFTKQRDELNKGSQGKGKKLGGKGKKKGPYKSD